MGGVSSVEKAIVSASVDVQEDKDSEEQENLRQRVVGAEGC